MHFWESVKKNKKAWFLISHFLKLYPLFHNPHEDVILNICIPAKLWLIYEDWTNSTLALSNIKLNPSSTILGFISQQDLILFCNILFLYLRRITQSSAKDLFNFDADPDSGSALGKIDTLFAVFAWLNLPHGSGSGNRKSKCCGPNGSGS